ncbi:hypothetical protein [Nonomuraea sp. NPDC023979]|uniref:hypothetical protein n=1 Tax=Nonomuraea sp. NPDC023979 TaxID=3154796 RepID=UPI0033DA81F8
MERDLHPRQQTGGPVLFRGNYQLPDIAQVCGVDWTALTIARHYGGHICGVRYLLDGQERYAIYSPDASHVWEDFPGVAELEEWLDAYGCVIEIGNNAFFRASFPADESAMRSLHDDATAGT